MSSPGSVQILTHGRGGHRHVELSTNLHEVSHCLEKPLLGMLVCNDKINNRDLVKATHQLIDS